MDNVSRGNQETNFLADRYHQRIIYFEQIIGVFGRDVGDLFARRGERAEVGDAFAHVLVLPTPLITGDQDIDVRFFGIVYVDQRLGGRHRHDDENDQRDNRPENLDREVLVKGGRLAVFGLAMHQHRPEHNAEHDDADHYTDPENGHVQVEYGFTDFGDARPHVDAPLGIGGRANDG